MKINIDFYRHAKQKLIKVYLARGLNRTVEMSIASGIHLIATYWFLNEEFPSVELKDKIKELCAFYEVEVEKYGE